MSRGAPLTIGDYIVYNTRQTSAASPFLLGERDSAHVLASKERIVKMMKRVSSRLTTLAACLLVGMMACAEDAYLHSDGSQYIDTGYVVKSTTRVELDMQLDATGKGDQYFFGTLGDRAGKLAFCSYTSNAGKYNYCCRKDSSDWVTTSCDMTTGRRTIVMDGYHSRYSVLEGGVTNFTTAISGAHDGCDTGVTMPVFAAYSFFVNTYSGHSAFKLFSLKIYEADELVMDFVPCIWDGELGLKDVKSGVLRKSAGGNALTYGGDIMVVDDGYIESMGEQYIDTGYRAKGTSRVEIDMAFVDAATAPGKYPFGVHVASSGLILGMYISSGGYCGWNCKDGAANWDTFDRPAVTQRRTYVIDGYASKCFVIAHGVTNEVATISTGHDGETLYTLPLFASHLNSEIVAKTAMKLYGFKAYESGALVRNYVPCIKGGVAGLKETISGTFYSNRATDSATGFAVGGDILQEEDDPYVKSDGFQAFSSGIVVDSTMRLELDFAPDHVSGTQYLLGSTTPYSGYLVFGAYINNGVLCVNCRANEANWQSVGDVPSLRERLVIDVLNGKVKVYVEGRLIREANITAERGTAENPLSTRYPIPLLGTSNANSEPTYITAAKVYGCQIYKNEVLVNDFKPYVKDSVVGLRDEKTGAFIGSPRWVKSFGAGGNIPANVEEDAYLSSSQHQVVNTGYIVNDSSRIEVDFAINQHTNGLERVFGSTAGGDYRFGLFASSPDASWGNFYFAAGPAGTTYNTGMPVDVARHTAIIDMKDRMLLVVDGTTTNYCQAFTAVPSGTVWPMGLFGEPVDEGFSSAQHLSNLRIYSVKISENGQMLHHYLPCKDADVIGFKDVITGAIKQDALGSDMPFAVGCRGWGEEHGAFYENPKTTAIWPGGVGTLSAFAPGAIAYQWLKDGEPIEGATESTYSLSWQRRAQNAEYSVRADFERYGVRVQSTSSSATVSHCPYGMSIIVR